MRHAEAERWALPPAEGGDLADAALAKRDGGGGRVLRRRLLRALAARVFALHPADVRFTRDARGRPGLAAPAAFISAAGCMTEGEAFSAVALSPVPLGIDLEAGKDTAELTRWTLTEAYVKALGRGLATPPEGVRMTRRGGRGWRLTCPGAPAAQGEVLTRSPLVAATALLRSDGKAGR